MYLKLHVVKQIIEDAIINKKILKVFYHHTDNSLIMIVKKKAPFDLGTTNMDYFERNKNNLYMFCYDHKDEKTGVKKQIVHAISALHIVKIEDTGIIFDPIALTDINLLNTKYDYRKCKWAIVPNRKWY